VDWIHLTQDRDQYHVLMNTGFRREMISLGEQPPASHRELCCLEFIILQECHVITLISIFFQFNYCFALICGLSYILIHTVPTAL
jgi:hypothetical protein